MYLYNYVIHKFFYYLIQNNEVRILLIYTYTSLNIVKKEKYK